jgi:small subunit ribosomal protein S8
MSNDRIADMLTCIRNASLAKHQIVSIPHSRITEEISKILVTKGFINSLAYYPEFIPEPIEYVEGNGPKHDSFVKRSILLELKYQKDKPFIQELKRISKSGQRRYAKAKKIPVVVDGYGKAILSTSKGIMTGDKARERGIGGEVLLSIW